MDGGSIVRVTGLGAGNEETTSPTVGLDFVLSEYRHELLDDL